MTTPIPQDVVDAVYKAVTTDCAIYDPKVREQHYKNEIRKALLEALGD